MSLALYMDVHVQAAITFALRHRGVDVLTAQEDHRRRAPDPELLDRATDLGRVIFSRDDDFLVEGVRRQRAGEFFAGIVFANQRLVSIGRCIADLELLALASEPDEFFNRIEFLPLK